MHEQQSSLSKLGMGSTVKQKTSIRNDDRLCMVAESGYFRELHHAFQYGVI